MPLALRFPAAPTFALLGVSLTPAAALTHDSAPALADRRPGPGARIQELRHVSRACR